jgi:hypothetical protein
MERVSRSDNAQSWSGELSQKRVPEDRNANSEEYRTDESECSNATQRLRSGVLLGMQHNVMNPTIPTEGWDVGPPVQAGQEQGAHEGKNAGDPDSQEGSYFHLGVALSK